MYLNSDIVGDIDIRVNGNLRSGVLINVHDNVQDK